MLNRIRIGKETSEDIEKLKERVRPGTHEDISNETDTLYIFGTNNKVNEMNKKRLNSMIGDEYVVTAICLHKTMKNFNPPEGKAGEVNKTPFQKELRVKVGAKVMLTYNVDTSDGLTNGARGELIGIIKDAKGNISKIVVKFERETVGKEKRIQNSGICQKYPGGTPIEKVNFPFSISKSKTSVINTATVIQFPLRLAFASTAHKIQGATIPKPQKVIINVTDTFAAAMVYVMLSRVCTLEQIFILNEFKESKMYPNLKALEELHRLDQISLNKNQSEWEKSDMGNLRISSLNCRSLGKHYPDISSDALLLKSDIIYLQETWIEDDESADNLQIPKYQLHLNSCGKGKGIATYFKNDIFTKEIDVKKADMQMSKFSSPSLDVISLYRSQKANYMELNQSIDALTDKDKPQLILGDFNFCYLENSSNATKKYLNENNFKQLFTEPTHIEGHLLDQAHLRDNKGILEATSEVHSKYYTDHKGLAIIIEKGEEYVFF
jgi:exonuclease III